MFLILKHFCSGPETPANITNTANGTRNLEIQWAVPEGRMEHYVVNISNEELNFFNSSTTTEGTSRVSFTHLYPGRIYLITVSAVAGNFMNSSEPSAFATRKFNIA